MTVTHKKFFITTPIYYVNDVPHLGHSYTTIAADTLARFKRLCGYDTFFLTGTDEHGQKIQAAADAKGIHPQELCDQVVESFKAAWNQLNVKYDYFVRTTDDDHVRTVQFLINKLIKNGSIYLGEYEGLYCPGQEEFVTKKQLVNGKHPLGYDVIPLKEESYLFKLGAMQDQLTDIIENDRYAIRPEIRKNEVLQFVKGELRDLSVSRTSINWGVPIPENEKHVVYVWIDALINYISAIGFLNDKDKFERYWPADVHLIGKDILRFHAVYWPAFLLAAGVEPPKMLFAHGFWTTEGQKMSKTFRNFLRPDNLIENYGVDPIRYFVLREMPFGQDGDFSRQRMIDRINSDLVNDLSNALSRTIGILGKYSKMTVPPFKTDYADDKELIEFGAGLISQLETHMDNLAFDEALKGIWEYLSKFNKYIDSAAPWTLKKQGDTDRLNTVLYNLVESLRKVALMIYPFMPETAENMWRQLGFESNITDQDLYSCREWGITPVGQKLRKGEFLYTRWDSKKIEAHLSELKVKKPEQSTEKKSEKPIIDFDTLGKLDLRIALVKKCESVPKAKKLLKLEIDIGDETRTIVAGIGKKYSPEELVGKRIVVVANLKPATIFGVKSNGMLLATGDDQTVTLLTVEGDVPPGSEVH